MIGHYIFKCHRCGFEYSKWTPSRVDKCEKCKDIVYERNYKGETLDPYSKAKERWYKDRTGNLHLEEIKRRKLTTINGKKVTLNLDDKGRVIDQMPTVEFDKSTPIGTKKNKQK